MGKPLRLVIVEDNDADVELLLRELRRGGFELTHKRVQTADELHAALNEACDLVISDYSMPSFGAPAALEVVRERKIDVPFIVVSGSIGEDRAVGILKAGAHDFITKENLARLLPAIARELGDAAEREARRAAEESLRLTEEQLRQSQKLEAVGQLAGGVAHDFNNLLTIINGRCQLALARMPPADPARKELEIVLQTGERAVSLTRQLLAFSRKQMLDPKVLNLNDLVQHLQQMLVRLLGEDVELRTKLAPDLWAAKVDPSQVDQIVMNLAVNARDAMPHGGGLVIETQNTVLDEAYASKHPAVKPGEYVMLSVSDTGCGMDEETKARIFEPFFTTKEMGRGTGLGLSTVYGIVKQSSGHIWVYSVPGQGTVFKIYLPRARGEKVEAESSEEARLKSVAGAETIMVVEDEDEIRELLNQVLASHGYKVLLAENGLKALDLAAAHSGEIHLLLADVVMPKLSGRELADRFMLTRPGTRLLFMSGFTDDALANRGVLGEDAAFLEKPFSIDLLALKVRQVLDAGKPDAPQEPPSSAT